MEDLAAYANYATRLQQSQSAASVGFVIAEAAKVVLSVGQRSGDDVLTAPLPSVARGIVQWWTQQGWGPWPFPQLPKLLEDPSTPFKMLSIAPEGGAVCLQLSELAAAAAAAAAAAQNGAVTSPTGMPQQGQNSPPIPATPAVQEQSRLVAESSSTSTVQHPQALTSYTTTATPLSVSKEAPSGSGKGMSTLRHALCAAACIAFPDPAPGSTACLLLAVTAAGCGHAGQDAGWWEVYEGAARDVHRRYAQALAAQAAASGQPPGSGATLPPLEVLVGSTQHAQHVAADMWPLFTVHSSGRSCFAMNAGALLQAAAKAVEEGVEDEVQVQVTLECIPPYGVHLPREAERAVEGTKSDLLNSSSSSSSNGEGALLSLLRDGQAVLEVLGQGTTEQYSAVHSSTPTAPSTSHTSTPGSHPYQHASHFSGPAAHPAGTVSQMYSHPAPVVLLPVQPGLPHPASPAAAAYPLMPHRPGVPAGVPTATVSNLYTGINEQDKTVQMAFCAACLAMWPPTAGREACVKLAVALAMLTPHSNAMHEHATQPGTRIGSAKFVSKTACVSFITMTGKTAWEGLSLRHRAETLHPLARDILSKDPFFQLGPTPHSPVTLYIGSLASAVAHMANDPANSMYYQPMGWPPSQEAVNGVMLESLHFQSQPIAQELLAQLRAGPPSSDAFLSTCLGVLMATARHVGHSPEEIRNLIDHSWMATTGGAWDENKAAEVAVQLRKAIATAGDPAARAALFPSQHPQPLPSGSTPQAPSILSPVSPVQGSIASFTSGSAHSPLTYPAAAAGGMGLGPEPRTPILPGNGPSWFSSTTSTSSTSSGGGSNGAQKGGTGGVRAAVSLSKTSEQEVRDALTLLDSDQDGAALALAIFTAFPLNSRAPGHWVRLGVALAVLTQPKEITAVYAQGRHRALAAFARKSAHNLVAHGKAPPYAPPVEVLDYMDVLLAPVGSTRGQYPAVHLFKQFTKNCRVDISLLAAIAVQAADRAAASARAQSPQPPSSAAVESPEPQNEEQAQKAAGDVAGARPGSSASTSDEYHSCGEGSSGETGGGQEGGSSKGNGSAPAAGSAAAVDVVAANVTEAASSSPLSPPQQSSPPAAAPPATIPAVSGPSLAWPPQLGGLGSLKQGLHMQCHPLVGALATVLTHGTQRVRTQLLEGCVAHLRRIVELNQVDQATAVAACEAAAAGAQPLNPETGPESWTVRPASTTQGRGSAVPSTTVSSSSAPEPLVRQRLPKEGPKELSPEEAAAEKERLRNAAASIRAQMGLSRK